MPATVQVPVDFIARDKFLRVVSKMTSGVKKFSKKAVASIKRVDNRINKTFKKIGRIGALIGGLTLGTLFTTAIQGNIAFNDSLASVSAITGLTGQNLVDLENKAKNTAKVHRKTGAEVLKAYELVGSAKPELLKNVDALDQVTQSVITLSKASRLDLEQSSLSLTSVMNQFGLAADQSGRTINVLAAGAKAGAAAIPSIAEAIQQFGTGAASFNVTMEESVGLIETLAAKGIKGAEAGTKLRNILTKMSAIDALPKEAITQLKKYGVNTDIVSDKTRPLNERLKELSKISKSSTALVKVFGLQNKEAGQVLLENLPLFDQMTKSVTGTSEAEKQAGINTNTLAFALQSIKTSFLNATTASNENGSSLGFLKDMLFSVADNMDTVLIVLGSLIGLYILWKTIVLAVTIATTANSIAMGINAVRTKSMSLAMKENVVAMTTYKIAMGISTAATWIATTATTAFGVALNLGLWPILAIIAAVVAVIAIIKNWSKITEWFGEKWKQFTGWISGLWGKVVNFFKEFDFKAMFMKIGQSIIRFMLFPLRMILTLLAKLPGKVGDLAQKGLDAIGNLTGDVNVNDERDGEGPLPSTTQSSNENVSRSITEKNSNVRLDIVDKGGNVGNIDNDDNIPITLGPTSAAF